MSRIVKMFGKKSKRKEKDMIKEIDINEFEKSSTYTQIIQVLKTAGSGWRYSRSKTAAAAAAAAAAGHDVRETGWSQKSKWKRTKRKEKKKTSNKCKSVHRRESSVPVHSRRSSTWLSFRHALQHDFSLSLSLRFCCCWLAAVVFRSCRQIHTHKQRRSRNSRNLPGENVPQGEKKQNMDDEVVSRKK